jgi:hypothetical protein
MIAARPYRASKISGVLNDRKVSPGSWRSPRLSISTIMLTAAKVRVICSTLLRADFFSKSLGPIRSIIAPPVMAKFDIWLEIGATQRRSAARHAYVAINMLSSRMYIREGLYRKSLSNMLMIISVSTLEAYAKSRPKTRLDKPIIRGRGDRTRYGQHESLPPAAFRLLFESCTISHKQCK